MKRSFNNMAGDSTALAATASREQLGQHIMELEQALQQASTQGKIVSMKNKPDKFHSKRGKVQGFLAQCHAYFVGFPQGSLDKKRKIEIAGSYLCGRALDWFKPYAEEWIKKKDQLNWELSEGTRKVYHNFKRFTECLKQIFGDPDRQQTIKQKIMSLQQKGSAAKYAARFQQLTELVQWQDNTVNMKLFKQGLKPQVRFKVLDSKPNTLQEIIKEAIQINNLLFEFNKIQHKGKKWKSPIGYSRERQDCGNPMEIDAIQKYPDKKTKCCQDKNLYFYCKKPGH